MTPAAEALRATGSQIWQLARQAATDTTAGGGYRHTAADALHAVYALAAETNTLLTSAEVQAVPELFAAARAEHQAAQGGGS